MSLKIHRVSTMSEKISTANWLVPISTNCSKSARTLSVLGFAFDLIGKQCARSSRPSANRNDVEGLTLSIEHSISSIFFECDNVIQTGKCYMNRMLSAMRNLVLKDSHEYSFNLGLRGHRAEYSSLFYKYSQQSSKRRVCISDNHAFEKKNYRWTWLRACVRGNRGFDIP